VGRPSHFCRGVHRKRRYGATPGGPELCSYAGSRHLNAVLTSQRVPNPSTGSVADQEPLPRERCDMVFNGIATGTNGIATGTDHLHCVGDCHQTTFPGDLGIVWYEQPGRATKVGEGLNVRVDPSIGRYQTGMPPPAVTARRPAAILASRTLGASQSSPSASPIPKRRALASKKHPNPPLTWRDQIGIPGGIIPDRVAEPNRNGWRDHPGICTDCRPAPSD
jgi:hypothetical protein